MVSNNDETESPIEIVGFDSVNDYYDVSLKEYRLHQIETEAARHPESRYSFVKGNLADKELVPMQAGDVPVTFADTSALERDFGFRPSTTLRQGLRAFARWYKEFYG